MSLTLQTINITTRGQERMACTMPAQHIYPFFIHRSVDEYLQKQRGERTRYSNKHCVTHLLSGGLLGVFPDYNSALTVVRKIKHHSIWLMPTYDLLPTHPDWPEVAKKVEALKSKYAIE